MEVLKDCRKRKGILMFQAGIIRKKRTCFIECNRYFYGDQSEIQTTASDLIK